MKPSLALFLLLLTPCGFALEYTANNDSWRLAVPEGFHRIALDKDTVIAAFKKDNPADATGRVIILVDLGAPIGREPLEIPPEKKDSLIVSRYAWKSFTVEAVDVVEEMDGVKLLTINAQVPIAPKAIEVKLFGLLAQRAQLQDDMKATLAGLDGNTNWLSGGQRIWLIITGSIKLVFVSVLLSIPIIYVIRKRVRAQKNHAKANLPS